MAGYPEAAAGLRVGSRQLQDVVRAVFAACGMPPAGAALLADSLVWADLRGIHSHGVLRVAEYVEKLTSGGVDPRGQPRLVRERVSALVVDGGNSMGQLAAAFAMDLAIERARSTGVAVAAVGGSNHCGALSWYAVRALEHGMIGVAATNALPTMAPWGGVDKIVGINPLAVALPSAGEAPVVLDCAFSYSSHGKIRVFAQRGLPIPPTWAFDREGRPTTDAQEAIGGLLQPIGEYKGVGLAVVFGLLSTALSGASYGTDLGDMTTGPLPGRDGHFCMAIDVTAFTDPDAFRSRVDRAVRQIRSSRLAAGHNTVYAPGGLEQETEARHRRDGIPLDPVTVDAIDRCARQLGTAGLSPVSPAS